MNYIYSITYHNRPGFIIRVALILERRGFQIEGLEVSPSVHPGMSELFLKVNGEVSKSEQITKQLEKLIDVVKVEEISSMAYSTSLKTA